MKKTRMSAAVISAMALTAGSFQLAATAAPDAVVAAKAKSDAAAIYSSAIAAVRTTSPAGSNLEYREFPPYGDAWEKMATASFEQNRPALELVRKARKVESATWVVGEKQQVELFNGLRHLANVVGDAALLEHGRKDDRAAFETLCDLDHLVLLLRKDLVGPKDHFRALVGIGLDAFASYRMTVIAADLQLADGAKEVKRLTIADADVHVKSMLAMPPAEPIVEKLFVIGTGEFEGKATDGPSRARAIEQARRSDAERAMAAMSLACKVFHHKRGRWPANLDELSSKLPRLIIDPWGDGKQTLGYVLIKAGLPDGGDRPLVYSRCESKDGLAYRVDEPQFGFYPDEGTNRPRAEQKRTGQFRDVTLWEPKPLPAGAATTKPLE